MIRYARLFLLTLLCLSMIFCVSCEEKKEEAEKPDVLSLDIESYVRLGGYKGMSLTAEEGSTKAETAWRAVIDGAQVISYPSGLVEYYTEQTEAKYRYYAEKNGIEYEQVLNDFKTDSEKIENESKALAKEDLVFAAVVRAEGISLTEEEKAAHFDRYVSYYVSEYGYNDEYVRENLSDTIYSSMLYDKTSEFLIINNTFN